MLHSCPKPCGRLATAAAFVSIGVIQFIAGLILLKSKYVYLLSGPDFWTAASNLAVGILLGTSVSVWKDVRKTSYKHVVRRNIIASLVISAIFINLTTAIILILGEGNALLSIQLEDDSKYPSASEILAYSYATSVCSPIVSVVVAVIFLSGMWFRVDDKEMDTPKIKSILKKNSFNDYKWVFKEKQSPLKQDSKSLRKVLSFKSLSSSSDDESFSLTDANLWSNSVHSIEYLYTSPRRRSHRIGMFRHGTTQQEIAYECGEHVNNNPENISHDTSRVSFADETRSKKLSKFSPRVFQRHVETDNSLYTDHNEVGNKNIRCLSFSDFKKKRRHYINLKQRYIKKRMLLMEHPAFQRSKFHKDDVNVQSFHKLASPEIHIPRAHARITSKNKSISSTTSEAKAEIHVDPKGRDLVVDGNPSETPVIAREDGVASCVLNETIGRKSVKFQRVSTLKHLKNSDASHPKDDSVNRKVCRTSTAADPNSSKISQLNISEIQNDSIIDQNESYVSEKDISVIANIDQNESYVSEKDISVIANIDQNESYVCEKKISVVTSPQSAISQMDSNIEIDDSFVSAGSFNASQFNVLAGEVVKVHVNSLTRRTFHSKLIPVAIPVIHSVKKNPLKRKQKESIATATDKFSDLNKLRFSSFHGDPKAMNKDSPNIDADSENEKYVAVNDIAVCEMSFDDKIPPSPAHTSGYDSTIFENSHLSGSEFFKPNSSISKTNSPHYTPKKKFRNVSSPRNLDNLQ